ncbi:MAG: CAP domain-containing protein [Planctomycetota bacterium]|nr:CAP domain-containing protein [Planctomycetota bacterium]
MILRGALLAIATALAAGWGSAAMERAVQEPAAAPAPPTLGELLRRMRAPDAKWWQREEAVEALIEHHGADGAKQAVRYAMDRLEAEGERWQKSRDRYLKHFEKNAPDAVLARSEKNSEVEIERLRKEALAVSRRDPLEKAHIVEEIDPKLERLGELLLVSVEQVLARDEELDAEREALIAQLDEVRTWWDLWRLAAAGWTRLDPEDAGEGAGAKKSLPEDPDPWQDTLDAEEQWQSMLATPMSERDRETLLKNLEVRAEILPEEYEGILFHNQIRIQLGLHAQRVDPKLCAAGRDHSKDMKELDFFAHESPVEGKKTPGDRAARFGTSAGAENIAMGMDTPRGAVMAWWHSPGHHKNMIGGADRIGLGFFERYWTEMFG